jgi:DNA-binding transcriptional MerR regulator
MRRATVSDIAIMTGLHENTIRRYADRGLIESRRDFRNWRYFPDPTETVLRIRKLLDGDVQLTEEQS